MKEMESEVVVPGSPQQLAADAALAVVLPQQGGSHPAQLPHVLPGRAVLEPAVVFPEDHIQHPVQAVLNPPMSPRGAAQFLGTAPPAANVVGHLKGFLVP